MAVQILETVIYSFIFVAIIFSVYYLLIDLSHYDLSIDKKWIKKYYTMEKMENIVDNCTYCLIYLNYPIESKIKSSRSYIVVKDGHVIVVTK